ncbi:MAG: CRISPR-associated endoribonuclease Cas2 [Myxococcota bacterium]|nr:CRISPR-associated endoribonuclease Cas2 [Myxococcota bacterium]
MWIFVLFDLPTDTKEARKAHANFRKRLKQDGFSMLQFSVYARPCPTEENAEVHMGRVQSMVPGDGEVRIFTMTDKQFGRMKVFHGKIRREPESAPSQLTIFSALLACKLPFLWANLSL